MSVTSTIYTQLMKFWSIGRHHTALKTTTTTAVLSQIQYTTSKRSSLQSSDCFRCIKKYTVWESTTSLTGIHRQEFIDQSVTCCSDERNCRQIIASSVQVGFAIPEPRPEVVTARHKCRTDRRMCNAPYNAVMTYSHAHTYVLPNVQCTVQRCYDLFTCTYIHIAINRVVSFYLNTPYWLHNACF